MFVAGILRWLDVMESVEINDELCGANGNLHERGHVSSFYLRSKAELLTPMMTNQTTTAMTGCPPVQIA